MSEDRPVDGSTADLAAEPRRDGGPVRLAVTGAGGRMGRAVIEAAAEREDCIVVLAVNRSATEPVAGVAVDRADRLRERLGDVDPDVLVDFTGPESAVEYAEAAAEAGVAVVTGTTGFDDDGTRHLRAASETVPLLKATNFSRGVLALRRAVREAVRAVPEYDVELTETHHNGKRDAPSGTALTLLDDVESEREALPGRGEDTERVHGREGDAPRQAGEIGVHARRAGDVTGEHEVLLAGGHETLELTHRAGDRGVFAVGALDAAVWLAEREAGWYTFADVIDAEADPEHRTDADAEHRTDADAEHRTDADAEHRTDADAPAADGASATDSTDP